MCRSKHGIRIEMPPYIIVRLPNRLERRDWNRGGFFWLDDSEYKSLWISKGRSAASPSRFPAIQGFAADLKLLQYRVKSLRIFRVFHASPIKLVFTPIFKSQCLINHLLKSLQIQIREMRLKIDLNWLLIDILTLLIMLVGINFWRLLLKIFKFHFQLYTLQSSAMKHASTMNLYTDLIVQILSLILYIAVFFMKYVSISRFNTEIFDWI